ncbi:unnamed protein product [Effrenium voratum]|uniref:Mei2-like C-terminal RNA recognition motif domain-containing protein n=1 Tax=Effrenium voratum TaxID=2562239 RepID=A0AA36IUH2_9DINO|nr:unnamed protein product [Effrenium voratum]CAJ1393101.1 unnamed protein product [Effrenium voratum]CAJ1460787.1 unnamed protein product [Effrenium voratum]|mmetsp:Transcript_97686/g.232545  ORF Transcript_97686/g.232545 Transcript_97686/m.232545 type:complete len:221 (-) Transcript_97686:91-753(-)|eukprot:CAMPEP_0181472902 /NCGR_PEP_ID=MMETSP1110-20121109/39845_1 /TAXON_ID=174948 /ORGANISM="Symbiodinium sp., Strain CCMP421" /LENGTH=220 /DNA_ID=CAMNT_0023597997 /DNA_START=59 /DNA_END=721 /DNA_ORIENTATION=+
MIDAPAAARIESIDADCTTLIMRGLNRQVSRDMVVTLLDEIQPGRCAQYDYIYVPWTTDGASNIGLAFVNFESPSACQEFLDALAEPESQRKIAEYHVRSVGPAAIQGKGANLTAMLGKRGLEALRGFDAPLVFTKGRPASLPQVVREVVPGALASAQVAKVVPASRSKSQSAAGPSHYPWMPSSGEVQHEAPQSHAPRIRIEIPSTPGAAVVTKMIFDL